MTAARKPTNAADRDDAQSLFLGPPPKPLKPSAVVTPPKPGARWRVVNENGAWFVVRGFERRGPFKTYEEAETMCDRLLFPERFSK